MAFVNLIIIKEKKIIIHKVGHSFVVHALNDLSLLDRMSSMRKLYLDSGYVLIDLNAKIIVSNQSAFASSHLKPEVRRKLWKEWTFLEQL